jgi:hypothetical protein
LRQGVSKQGVEEKIWTKEEVAGGCRGLRNEELHNLYTSPSIIKVEKSQRMRWLGHVELMGDMRITCIMLVRPRRRWEENIRIDLREIDWEGVEWIHLAQDKDQWRALVNTDMKLRNF